MRLLIARRALTVALIVGVIFGALMFLTRNDHGPTTTIRVEIVPLDGHTPIPPNAHPEVTVKTVYEGTIIDDQKQVTTFPYIVERTDWRGGKSKVVARITGKKGRYLVRCVIRTTGGGSRDVDGPDKSKVTCETT